MKRSLFSYELPEESIAYYPPNQRGTTRLLQVHKNKKNYKSRMYKDIVDLLHKGDGLVINTTKVGKFRITTESHLGKIELLFLHPIDTDEIEWKVRIGGIKNLPQNKLFEFGKNYRLEIFEKNELYFIRFIRGSARAFFLQYGTVPIPPYLRRNAETIDEERYNTLFSKQEQSVAAPTASLNMTDELLSQLRMKGVNIIEVELYIGWGTFAPIHSENIEDHRIHEEYYVVPKEASDMIAHVRSLGKYIWALGTTAARVLESVGRSDGTINSGEGWTNIYIYPGYTWNVVDHLITNFHAPESSLLAMVASFAGRECILDAYKYALEQDYKFLSYGDSMVIM
ncbi:tRNA preQ1(34) S-adenosylmethionine ribosyltransferase-isomerase QueA [Candidatus Dojkabacteria bacterium]|uniref:S-adenosylmethionine:tRNA ribosyltransferase-isomerase n=1 Tax=Candidatus Dojkabacteria bacterium TaxID=2099670 RepID=A0A955L878_9BACT|nr:tRNA preQ1(34) S-adenosylmethionine ribosyltransferase-isomerase QueA [Candidatus Dojkabacteria bacterium]